MIIQHNLSALNAHRNLGKNNKDTAGQLEKLSSGYKVNRAADDAAGLAISEKMRGQIRGLGMAEQNATHAIDLIQTAEGGLNESHAVLQRMRELAVQASNGTYTDEDRQQITLEFEALKQEIDRIAESTNYNGIKLLNGNLGSTTVDGLPVAGQFSGNGNYSDYNLTKEFNVPFLGVEDDGTVSNSNIKSGPYQISMYIQNNAIVVSCTGGMNAAFDEATGVLSVKNLISPSEYAITEPIDVAQLKELLYNLGADQSPTPNVGTLKILLVDPGKFAQVDGNCKVSHNTTNTGFADLGLTVTAGATPGPKVGGDYSMEIAKSGSGYIISIMTQGETYSYVASEAELSTSPGVVVGGVQFQISDPAKFADAMNGGKIVVNDIGSKFINHIDSPYILDFSSVQIQVESGLVFQIGANGGEDQRVWLSIANMSADAIGVWDGDTLTDGTINDHDASLFDARIDPIEEANFAIEIIHSATQQVSATRANLGAMQNRLEHALNNLGVTKENLTAAESVIRDTDMAAAMAEFTKANIMVQASQAMLAQAQQLPQGVLQLLR